MQADDYKKKGNDCMAAKDFDGAIECYTLGLKLEPTNHILLSNRSAAYLSVHKCDEALSDAEKCIEVNPQFVKGYGRKGAALFESKQLDESISAYKKGLEIAPGDAALQRGLEDAMKAQKDEDSTNRQYAQQMNQMLIDTIYRDPELADLREDKEFMKKLTNQGNPMELYSDPRFMRVFQKALGTMGANADFAGMDSSPKRSEPVKKPEPAKKPEPEVMVSDTRKKSNALREEGNEFYKKKDFPHALDKYFESLTIDPTNLASHNNIAAVYLEQNLLDECIAECEKVIELCKTVQNSFEDKAKAYMRIGNAEMKRNQYDNALIAYNNSKVEFKIKGIDDKIKFAEKAKTQSEKEAYYDPALAAEAKERGNQYFKDGLFGDAIKEYDEAIKRDPKNPAYLNNRGTAFHKLGVYGSALKDVNKAIEMDNKYLKAYYRKGLIEISVKKYHLAYKTFSHAMTIDANDEAICEGMKQCMMAINDLRLHPLTDTQRDSNMSDPEIQAIMGDPLMQSILQESTKNPRALQKHLENPAVAERIQMLVAAGIVSLG